MMVKSIKKIAAAIAAGLLGVALLPVSLWADNGVAPDKGSLTIHRYILESMDQAGIPNDGTELANVSPEAIAVQGIEFTLWQVDTTSGLDVNDTTDIDKNLLSATKRSSKTDDKGAAFFADLPAGLYYVKETKSEGVLLEANNPSNQPQHILPCEPFLVSVPMENPAKDSWITDVHVYPKSQHVGVDKYVNEAGNADPNFSTEKTSKHMPVAKGEAFGWTIEGAIPWEIGESNRSYTIEEKLNTNFDFDIATLQVYSVPDKATPTVKAHLLTKDTHYTVSSANEGFVLKLTEAGRSLLQTRYDDISVKDRFVRVKFDTKLKDKAVQSVDIAGDATLIYSVPAARSMRAGVTSLSSEVINEPTVHTGQIRLMKYDATTKTSPLAGAEFGLALTEEDARAGRFVTTAVSDANGEIVFAGLSYGAVGDKAMENSVGTVFWIVETKAPDGDTLAGEMMQVQFDYHQNATNKEYYFAEVVAYNQKATTVLPTTTPPAKTSDSMQIVFVASGIMMLALAVFIVAWKSKNKLEKMNRN